MNRTRFHEILHGNTTQIIIPNQNSMVFHLKKIRKVDTYLSLAKEKDKVDVLYDSSYNYFYLSPYPWEKEEEEENTENMDISDIYVGDYQEKDIYFTNPLLEEK